MATKVKELDNTKDGDRNACPICNPVRKGRRSMSDLWEWQRDNPGKPVFK